MQRQSRGAITLLTVVFAVIIVFVLSRSGDLNLTGSAVIDTPDSGGESQEVSQTESGSESQPSAQDTTPQPGDPPTAVPPTPVPATPVPPTALPPTEVLPTAVSPTEIPPTEVPPTETSAPGDISAEPTAEVTAPGPEETEIPSATPESTSEITPEATLEPELTPEVTAEATAELTPEATEEPVLFEIMAVCTGTGTRFTITNLGADMVEAAIYTIDGVEGDEVLLASGTSQTVDAGYGTPVLSLGGNEAQPETPCAVPADLAVTTECTLESGVTFAVTNMGGAMAEEQPYSITSSDGETSGTLLLGAGESVEIPAGYGSPSFMSGALNAQIDPACEPPAHVEGRIWLDKNGDGAYSDDEPGIAGVIIELINSDNFPVQTITAENGLYDFFPVGAGEYTVRLLSDSLPADTEASSDPDGDNNGETGVAVAPGETYSLSFGYASTGQAVISGSIWLEVGNFGVRDGNERGLNNVTVQLTNLTGTVIAEMVVSIDGVYRFEGLASGEYLVRLVADSLPQPYGITFNPDDNYDLETHVAIESPEQIVTDIHFGVVGTF